MSARCKDLIRLICLLAVLPWFAGCPTPDEPPAPPPETHHRGLKAAREVCDNGVLSAVGSVAPPLASNPRQQPG
jgi:hypothetical protein